MTERKGSEKPHPKVTSAELDRYIDTRGVSYDDAYRHFGITSPEEIDFSDDPDYQAAIAEQAAASSADGSNPLAGLKGIEPGPSLSLTGRARALDTIMRQFNQENKTRGAHESFEYNGMDRRYDRPTEVLGNMRSRSSRMGREAVEALDILAEGDSDVRMPASEDHAEVIESRLRKEFGPGVAYADKREKMLRRAYKAAGLKRPRK